jgi:hypothetical protein
MLLRMLGNSRLLFLLEFERVVLGVLKRGFRVLLLLRLMPFMSVFSPVVDEGRSCGQTADAACPDAADDVPLLDQTPDDTESIV